LKILIGRILFALAFAVAGLWLAKMSVLAFRMRQTWRREGVVVDGEIVGFEERADTDITERRKLFAPIVTFRTVEGAPMRFTSSVASRPNPYTVGQSVRVRYMRLTPARADLDSAAGSLFVPLATAVMAIVFLGASLLPILLKPPAPR
jgi:hypothetical protein